MDYDCDENDNNDYDEDYDLGEALTQRTQSGSASRQPYHLSADRLGEWAIRSKQKVE